MPVTQLKEAILRKITAAAQKAFGQDPDQIEIGFPPHPQMGHFAVGCFSLSKQIRKSPAEIAAKIVAHIEPDDLITKAGAAGPYINLTISEDSLL